MKHSKSKKPTTRLASVDQIARSIDLDSLVESWGFASVVDGLREVQRELRLNQGRELVDLTPKEYEEQTRRWLGTNRTPSYSTVFNLTGTILHTNLGRALIDQQLALRSIQSAVRPVNLEFDVARGLRGDREAVIRERLCRLTGSESATVVNNNAAAVVLMLNTLAHGREVLVSRGELIEIGGSFRLPEIMSRAGCRLVEVGTTNRSRLEDFTKAITSNTALILKVHPSNYSIHGFTESVDERELAQLAQEHHLPCVLDLGSGALIDWSTMGIPREPLPQDSLRRGVDLVSFSGDKLMGGPQAGLIVGSASYIEQLNSNPLKRALRTDKLTLAILDETLKAYEDKTTVRNNVKLIRDVTISHSKLLQRARKIQSLLEEIYQDFSCEVVESTAKIGSGAQPDTQIPSVAVSITHERQTEIHSVEEKFRSLHPAVIGRRNKGRLLLDMRGAEPLDKLLETLLKLR